MTIEEFSSEFDTLLNSYNNVSEFGDTHSRADIVLDEYEKSLFLTKAQESIVISLYNGKLLGDSFEKTEELRKYLNNLVKTSIITDKQDLEDTKLSSNSSFFKLPDDLLFITYEQVHLDDESAGCYNGNTILVVPVTQDEYFRINRNPFKNSNKRRALRLDIDDNIVEIISKYNIDQYQVRYVSKPSPIILIDLPDNLSIDNQSNKSECKLNPAIHRVILEMAVELAIKSKAAGK